VFDERLPWLVGLHAPAADRAFFRDRAFAEDLIGFVAFCEGRIDQFYVLPQQQRESAGGALLQIAKASGPICPSGLFSGTRPPDSSTKDAVSSPSRKPTAAAEREPDVLYRCQAG
jgi:putative acetyltransferase